MTLVLIVAIVFGLSVKSDQLTRERLSKIVEFALAKSINKIPYDQESVAIWDDAVENVRNGFNEKWVDINLGVWMYDYFKHDRIYVIDANGQQLYAMADGRQAIPGTRNLSAFAAHLVGDLRKSIASGALESYEAGAIRIPRVVDLGFEEDRPAIASVMPLISDTGDITQARGTESAIVSIRFLDSSFLPDLADQYLLKGVRFSRSNNVASNEQSLPMKDKAGRIVGHFVWSPELPGWTMLADLIPVFALGAAAIAVAVAFLLRNLWRSCAELIASEAHSRHLAYHDVLTGLPNRAFFNDRLEFVLEQVRQGHGQAALMFLDLDRFKQVNDTLGHAAGDALIREVAMNLRKVLGTDDILARTGGDEFAIIIMGASRKDAEDFCAEVIAVASRPFELDGNHAVVGVSIGVAMVPEVGTDRGEVARKADVALYRAKRHPLQRFQFFTEEMGETIKARHTLEMELRRSLVSSKDLEVMYQPVYAAKGESLVGAEALVRWNHPRHGPISPVVFVAIAEECGLIDRLGEWVLRHACEVAHANNIKTIAVNVSPIQVLHADFVDRVLGVLRETKLDPSRLELEITEGVLLESSGASAAALNVLRSTGVRIALDDFGTGYSSLSYLINLEIDRIKIDRSFVQHVGLPGQSRSIVEAIVSMAKALDVAVTAEGVETESQRKFLLSAGCDQLQGYLFSPPVSASRLRELIAPGSGQAEQAA